MELAELLASETDDPDALVEWAKERANQFVATLEPDDELVGLLEGLRLDVPALLNGEPGTAAKRPNPPIPRSKPASLRVAEEPPPEEAEEDEEIEELDAEELEELDMDELELIEDGDEDLAEDDGAPIRTGGTDVQPVIDEPIAEDDEGWADEGEEEDGVDEEEHEPVRTGGTAAQPVVDEPLAEDDDFDDLDPDGDLDDDDDDDDDIDIDLDMD